MKKTFLLLTLIALFTAHAHAQLPVSIRDADAGIPGAAYQLKLTSESHCPTYMLPAPINIVIAGSAGNGTYRVVYCEDVYGDGTEVIVQAQFTTGKPVILATHAPVSFTINSINSTYNAAGVRISPTLPIELLSFTARVQDNQNLLEWQTASEKDNSHFDIERSTDGKTFHNIGQVKGNNKPSSYEYIDKSPLRGLGACYYRLRQIDFDGTETLSKIVAVTQTSKDKGLKIYPTLVSNGILTIDTEGVQSRDFSITNLLGQQVLAGKTPPTGAGGLDVSALSQGTYVLKVGTEVAKFVKQ